MEQVYPNERLSVAMGVILPPPQKNNKKKSVEKGLSLEKNFENYTIFSKITRFGTIFG